MSRSPSPPLPLQVPIQGLSFDGFISFLSVCPIHFHFRLLICMGISISSVLLQSSSYEITFGQWMFRILHKQWLTKVCSLEVVVFISFHASDPYSNTDLTLLQKMRRLVLIDILLFFHTGQSCMKATFLFEFIARHPAQLLQLW